RFGDRTCCTAAAFVPRHPCCDRAHIAAEHSSLFRRERTPPQAQVHFLQNVLNILPANGARAGFGRLFETVPEIDVSLFLFANRRRVIPRDHPIGDFHDFVCDAFDALLECSRGTDAPSPFPSLACGWGGGIDHFAVDRLTIDAAAPHTLPGLLDKDSGQIRSA